MKESLDRSELRRMQREQERERRRIRDRQRRQSMTVEQRERHLARRRRNYQLRRLRAENAKVDFPQISNEHEADAAAAAAAASDVHESDMSTEPLQSLDAVACKASHLTTKRLRLSHVRRLARSVVSRAPHHHHIHILGEADDDANKTSCFQIADFDSGRLPNGLRLNRVKRLARAINTASKEASVNDHQVTEKITMEQNHSLEERQWISNDNSSLPDVMLKDLTWTDKHPSWANVES